MMSKLSSAIFARSFLKELADVSCCGPGINVCQTNDSLEIERTIKHIYMRRYRLKNEVIVFMNPNYAGQRRVIHRAIEELKKLMRVLRISFLQEGVLLSCRGMDVGHCYPAIHRHK